MATNYASSEEYAPIYHLCRWAKSKNTTTKLTQIAKKQNQKKVANLPFSLRRQRDCITPFFIGSHFSSAFAFALYLLIRMLIWAATAHATASINIVIIIIAAHMPHTPTQNMPQPKRDLCIDLCLIMPPAPARQAASHRESSKLQARVDVAKNNINKWLSRSMSRRRRWEWTRLARQVQRKRAKQAKVKRDSGLAWTRVTVF